MQVCYFWSEEYPQAKAALPSSAETIWTGGSPTSYWKALKSRWTGQRDMLVIEQDILIHDQVIPQLEACDKDWCVFPYLYGTGNVVNLSGPQFMTTCLGCTRFSKRLQRVVNLDTVFTHPKAVYRRQACADRNCTDDAMCWKHIDQVINQVLELAGYEAHWHMPMVSHGHYVNVVEPVYAPAPPEDEVVEMVLKPRQR